MGDDNSKHSNRCSRKSEKFKDSSIPGKGAKSRRSFIKLSGAAAAAVGLAGCSGDESPDGANGGAEAGGGDGASTTTISMTGAGSFSLGTAQALQNVVRGASDTVDVNVSEVSGNPESISEFGAGRIDSYSTENFTVGQALEGEGPFQEQMEVAPQGFVNLLFHYYIMAVDGSGLETVDDIIEQDVNFWPFPPAWGSRLVQENVFEAAGVWDDLQENVVDLEAGDVPGAIQEGRVDAFMAQGATYEGLPGWGTEIDAGADVHVLETTDTVLSGIEQVDGIEAEEIEPYGWTQDVRHDTVTAWNNGVQFCFSADLDNEVVYELARISHEHPEDLREAMGQYMHHGELENMTENLLPDVPVHPGVAEFLQDRGAWDDELTIAE